MLMDVIRGSISADSLCTVCSHCLLNLRSCWLSMQLKPGHTYTYTRKEISGDCSLWRCSCGGGWKRSAGEIRKQMKKMVPKMAQEKRNLVDLILRRKKNCISHVLKVSEVKAC